MGVWKLVAPNEETKYAIAISSFHHDSPQAISFKIGDRLELKEECDEWYRGHIINKPQNLGIFPKSFVKFYNHKGLVHNFYVLYFMNQNKSDPSVYEIESTLREWANVWFKKFEECEKRRITHCLMGYYKNILNLKNVIVENRASIDEIKELKKSTVSKILQGNSLLGLDVIAFDSNYNRLDSSDATTILLYEEIKKNSDYKNQSFQPHIISQSSMPPTIRDESLNETSLSHFQHKASLTNSNQQISRASSTYCLKLSIESLIPSQNYVYTDENCELCVNLFLYKENALEQSYYLCENAYFNMSQIASTNRQSSNNDSIIATEDKAANNQAYAGKFALFCDISEKDFELTKAGYKLFLVVYAIKHSRLTPIDRHASISRVFAGGVCDLGSNLCNLVYVAADVRNIQTSMILSVNDFETSIVNQKILQEFMSTRDSNDVYKSGKTASKDSYLTLTFRCELNELSFKNACDKFGHLQPRISRKMDFPEIIMPDDFRNDFYVTVIGGDFQKARNYEFVVNLVQFRDDGNKLVEIPVDFSDENEETIGFSKKKIFFYKSIVYTRQDKPKWNEIVNVSIPHGKKVEEIKKTFLRFLIRNRSLDGKDKTKMIGTCYLQLTNEDGSAIKDIHCYLPMHKIENEVETNSLDGFFYPLKTPPSIQKSGGIQVTASLLNTNDKLKDFIDVKVKVVSTQLTQNVTLLNLLSFSTDAKPDADRYQKLLTYLDELLSVKDEQSAEIVKFLQAILDKLIDILLDIKTKHTKDSASISEKAYEMHSKQIQIRVFEILVAIFQIIENQNKFASFRTVIDAYLSKNFCITLAHRPLLRIFYEQMNNIYEKYSSSSSATTTPQLQPRENPLSTPSMIGNGSKINAHRHSGLSASISLNNSTGGNSTAIIYEDNENENAINTIKSMEYIFKFAFRSRELLSLYSRANNPQSDLKGDTFDVDITNIFKKLTEIAVLKNTSYSSDYFPGTEANLTKIQSFILKNLISLLPILIKSKRFSIQKISEFYIGFLQSRFILQTQFLSKFIRTKLFENEESRRVLMDPLCKALTNLLTIDNPNEEKTKIDMRLESIGKVFAELMDVLEKKNIGNINNDMNDISCMLLQLSNTFLYFRDQTEPRQLYGSVIISIMRSMNSNHFELFFDSSTSLGYNIEQLVQNSLSNNYSLIDERINKFIIQKKSISNTDSVSQLVVIKLIYTCEVLLKDGTFPRDWFDLLILRNSVILNAMYHIADRICRYHLEDFNYLNKEIWYDYFNCMVLLTTDPCLQLENFNENKRKNVLLKYKDIRVKTAIEIKKMWYNLGDKKSLFIPNMVEPFLRVALIPINEIHNAIIPLFFDMINCEHLNKGNNYEFDKYSVPRQLITTLDIQLVFGNGEIKFRNAFEKIMKEKFNAHINLRNNVSFVKNVVDLFDLLVEYRDLKSDSADELKTFYLNEILMFYGNLKRYDIYVKYIEILRQIHKQSNNPVCAAYTLKLHAELLYWTNDLLEIYLQHPSYPYQKTHKDLKELLFIDLINDFTEGQAWEKALELSKILRGIYDSQYEFEKLSTFLRKQADLCENIIKLERYESKYFLVGFFGKGFPRLLQNKQFVFRSEPFEQIMTFRQRIESWFPDAKRISHSNQPNEEEISSYPQSIQIISVTPVYEPKDHFKGLNLSQKILRYYHHNEVNKFKFTYRKDSKLNEDDPSVWWLIEKSWQISNTLPDVINFYPVVSESVIDISPIQNALNTVRDRLDKLKMSYNKIERTHEVDEASKQLIQGTIDAGVLGGLPRYKKFESKSYLETNPDSGEKIEELKSLINQTINLGEAFLDLSLEYLPNDDLLNILKREQLPKLKSLFDIPLTATLRKKSNPIYQNTSSLTTQQSSSSASSSYNLVESTPKSSSKQSISLNDTSTSSSNRSFFKQIANNETGRGIFSYIVNAVDKNNSNQLFSNTNNNSHRDSVSSIKSLNSDEEPSKGKIVLDETVNPKRPLRPRVTTQNSASSPSNSNQSSRPISHLSGDEISSISMQQVNSNNTLNLLTSKIVDNLMQEEIEADSMQPPPKPPKPINMNKIKLNIHSVNNSNGSTGSNGASSTSSNQSSNGSHSSENLINSKNPSDNYNQAKTSSSSLNAIQFRYLTAKTTSDSILNRFPDGKDLTKM